MAYRCINEPFAYCSGTPKATMRLPDPATGKPMPGFEYDGGFCVENYKSCSLYRKASAVVTSTKTPVPLIPTPVATPTVVTQPPVAVPVAVVPTVAPTPAPMPVPTPVIAPTPIPEPEFESIFLRGF